MSFTFRIRYHPAPETILDIDQEVWSLALGGPCESLEIRGGEQKPIKDATNIIVRGTGFGTDEEARNFGELTLASLLVALARLRVGADFGDRAGVGRFTAAGFDWIKEEFGKAARNDVHGLMTFPTEPRLAFAKFEAQLQIHTSRKNFELCLRAALDRRPSFTIRERIAFQLFNAALFQRGPDARFLLLTMSIEAMSDRRPRSGEAIEHVNGLVLATERNERLPQGERESLLRSLEDMRNEAIGRAGRRLVKDRLPSARYDERTAVQFFTDCYDLRSRLVHGADPYPTVAEVSAAAGALELFVSDLLTSPFLERRSD